MKKTKLIAMKIESNYICSLFVLLYLKGILRGCVTIHAFEFQIFIKSLKLFMLMYAYLWLRIKEFSNFETNFYVKNVIFRQF